MLMIVKSFVFAGDLTLVKLKSGEVYHTDSVSDWIFLKNDLRIEGAVFSEGVSGFSHFSSANGNNESVIMVMKGSARFSTPSDERTVKSGELLYFTETGTGGIWPLEKESYGVRISFKGQASEWQRSHLPGAVFSFEDLQYTKLDDNTDARIIQAGRGHVASIRIKPDSMMAEMKTNGESCWLVTRGSAIVNVAGGIKRISENDFLFVEKNHRISFQAGSEGCDAVFICTPGNPVLQAAYGKRIRTFATFIAPGTKPKLLVDGSKGAPTLTFTEGPSWMNGAFYFSNYYWYWKDWMSSNEGGVCTWHPDHESFGVLNKNVQTCGTTPLPNGMLAVCDLFQRGVVEMDPNTGRMGKLIVNSYEGVPFAVANDIITDRKGGLYITDSSVAKTGPKQPGTALYYLAKNGDLARVTEPNAISYINGVVLTPDDKTLYLNGSGEIFVYAFDVNPDGSLSNIRPHAELFAPDETWRKGRPSGTADGMTIDSEGNLYVATTLGIQIIDSHGEHVGIIKFPQSPSHCVFGGDDLTTLYVTARKHIYSIQTLKKGLQYPLAELED